jgi:hypothetical protein
MTLACICSRLQVDVQVADNNWLELQQSANGQLTLLAAVLDNDLPSAELIDTLGLTQSQRRLTARYG